MNIYTVYKATNTITGKCYIGFDSAWPSRMKDHKRDSKSNTFIFHAAIRKYGWDKFIWEPIYQSTDSSYTLKVMEPYFILENNSCVFFKNSKGYNMTEGGDGTVGYHHSITGKQNISISKKGKRYISETHDCKFCNQLYATRQLPVHERSCESNPNKIPGIGTGRTTDIKTTFCQYCDIEFKRTSMGRHERTCNANPNKEIIEYKQYKQKTSTCEHCNKTGGIGIMKRYHHDNCRVSVRV